MEKQQVIYLAGGCFWGTEQLMRSIPGVVDACPGYANGSGEEEARYETVCRGTTGFRETVKVTYDPEAVSLDALLSAYFYVVDTGVRNRQGNDVGTQYQAGIYYADEESKQTVERLAAVEKSRRKKFFVEIGPLVNFFPAEEMHQRYLQKHPDGYCHIPREQIRLLSKLHIDPAHYQRPDRETLRQTLSPEAYHVTQENGTEQPFVNAYWNHFQRGIYVDVTTGEPLFSSEDQFASGCGWPAFSKPIEAPAVFQREDTSHGMVRTEVRSRVGDSHLGHVFFGEPGVEGGVRYCINSASLRFIPAEQMEQEGYGALLELFASDKA